MITAILNEQSDEEEIHVTSYMTDYPAEAKHQKTSASNLLPNSLLANDLINHNSDIYYTPISLIDYQSANQADIPITEPEPIRHSLPIFEDQNLIRDYSNLSNDSMVNTPRSLSHCDEFSHKINQVNYLPIRTNQETNSDITIESAYNLINSDLSTTKVIFIINTATTICAVSKLDLFDSIYKTNKTIMWGNTQRLSINLAGDIIFQTNTNLVYKLTNVLYVPQLGINILSTHTLKNSVSLFNREKATIFDQYRNIMLIRYKQDNLYQTTLYVTYPKPHKEDSGQSKD
jgi:hypothetical protein